MFVEGALPSKNFLISLPLSCLCECLNTFCIEYFALHLLKRWIFTFVHCCQIWMEIAWIFKRKLTWFTSLFDKNCNFYNRLLNFLRKNLLQKDLFCRAPQTIKKGMCPGLRCPRDGANDWWCWIRKTRLCKLTQSN